MCDYNPKDLSEPEDGDSRDDDAKNIDKRAFDEMNKQTPPLFHQLLE
ncbi:heat shock factor-binding protein 1 [Aphis craccivora]|uniref:Heat shock factor-binding protein 1 n=1 Tax=Aphis craccivora TaxID=307492 RepID=A0A6G0Z3I2_APHCR|nr:heat shock factor-binding protein 1 [Aphis craccivora]